VTASAVPDEHSPKVGGLENTGTQPGRLDQYQPGRLILTAGPIPSFLLADPGRSVCSAGAELMDVIVRCPVEDSGDRTLAGKVRNIAHHQAGGGRGIGQGSQINI
jgi:hypothetical protein